MLAIIAYAAIFNMLTMILQNKTICVCLALITVMASMFLCFYLMKRLEGPPMVEVYQMVNGQTTTETVSYTHLDVYKRQVFCFVHLQSILQSDKMITEFGRSSYNVLTVFTASPALLQIASMLFFIPAWRR